MDSLRVEVDAAQGRISVYYNGRGVPIELVFSENMGKKSEPHVTVCLQVRFANKAATIAGGTHVGYLSDRIDAHVASFLNQNGWREA
ncbi:hypothetical protein C2845_PM15G11560 [Panicum miliaceum]|uniref:Uncharacterized protein n=1 Tax=Panicum miliaceum TaxID=4540 RepID=A0A3L6Q9I1_PANMI|nr:hypothetical protein C2845_PM15G11560 [Panicum miliaceum]